MTVSIKKPRSKPWRCGNCPLGFVEFSLLKRHALDAHPTAETAVYLLTAIVIPPRPSEPPKERLP